MARGKQEVVSFKIDAPLLVAMDGIANRSEFIRNAILAAMEGTCPLCMGTGVLSPKQKEHWDAFARNHPLRQCPDCHETHITCSKDKRGQALHG